MKKTVNTKSMKRQGIVLLLSVGIGLAGAWYAQAYISSEIAAQRQDSTEPVQTVKVVVPKRSLVRGDIVRKADLAVRDIPARFADSNSVSTIDYDQALGQRLSFDIDEGSALLWAHLEGGRTPTFSGKVPNGLRALTVRVDEINSISGFLQPKDRIDLLLTHGSGRSDLIRPLLQNLEVIATGTQTVIDKSYEGGRRLFNTITVQVTPEDAQRITLAQQIGRLTALLRNPDDLHPLSAASLSAEDLLGQSRKTVKNKVAKRTSSPSRPRIEYIIGGS